VPVARETSVSERAMTYISSHIKTCIKREQKRERVTLKSVTVVISRDK
jgi:hypothetical protein